MLYDHYILFSSISECKRVSLINDNTQRNHKHKKGSDYSTQIVIDLFWIQFELVHPERGDTFKICWLLYAPPLWPFWSVCLVIVFVTLLYLSLGSNTSLSTDSSVSSESQSKAFLCGASVWLEECMYFFNLQLFSHFNILHLYFNIYTTCVRAKICVRTLRIMNNINTRQFLGCDSVYHNPSTKTW